MADASPPLVSVIVVSWNSRRFLEGCLSSVMAQTHPAVELIVVDNGSSDGSAGFVEERFPSALLIPNRENLGFCRANNDALKRCGGVFILCLNADAVLEDDYLATALPLFEADHRLGMVAGKILRFDGRLVDSAGQELTRARRIRDRGYGRPDAGQFEDPADVFSVCGAVALYRREMVDDVSVDGEFFDETFFSFGEDMDVCWRAQRAGWRGRYLPSARARHFRGGSRSADPSALGRFSQMAGRPHPIRAHIVKNRYLMILKNDSPGALLRDLPFILAWEAVQWAWLLLASPGTLPHLWRSRGLAARALERRRRGPAARGAAGA